MQLHYQVCMEILAVVSEGAWRSPAAVEVTAGFGVGSSSSSSSGGGQEGSGRGGGGGGRGGGRSLHRDSKDRALLRGCCW